MSRKLLWIIPVSFGLGAVLSILQPGNWLNGWLAFLHFGTCCIITFLIISIAGPVADVHWPG